MELILWGGRQQCQEEQPPFRLWGVQNSTAFTEPLFSHLVQAEIGDISPFFFLLLRSKINTYHTKITKIIGKLYTQIFLVGLSYQEIQLQSCKQLKLCLQDVILRLIGMIQFREISASQCAVELIPHFTIEWIYSSTWYITACYSWKAKYKKMPHSLRIFWGGWVGDVAIVWLKSVINRGIAK